MRALGRALGLMRAYWPQTLVAFCSLLLVTAGNLVIPQLIRALIDSGIRSGDESLVLRLAGDGTRRNGHA